MMLTPEEQLRYSRQTCLPRIGEGGQRCLLDARVLLLGLGGLGSPAALYLAAAGVGTLGVAEFDTVALHNLQRQVLFREADAGTPKIDAGFTALRALNAHTRLVAHREGLTPANALALFAQYDLVLDGTDNFAARFLANDTAVLARRPLVHGSVFQFTAQIAVFDGGGGGPCYRCMFPEMPDPATVPACEETGVIGALCGIVGSAMALEAVKLITGAGKPLRGRVLLLDALAGTTQTAQLPRNPECPVCGAKPRITSIAPENYVFGGCAIDALPARPAFPAPSISCEEAAALLASPPSPLLLDVRRADERAICKIPNSHHIPLNELPARLGEIPAAATVLVYCHHGQRSQQAVQILKKRGIPKATSIQGGIARWATAIDPRIARY